MMRNCQLFLSCFNSFAVGIPVSEKSLNAQGFGGWCMLLWACLSSKGTLLKYIAWKKHSPDTKINLLWLFKGEHLNLRETLLRTRTLPDVEWKKDLSLCMLKQCVFSTTGFIFYIYIFLQLLVTACFNLYY